MDTGTVTITINPVKVTKHPVATVDSILAEGGTATLVDNGFASVLGNDWLDAEHGRRWLPWSAMYMVARGSLTGASCRRHHLSPKWVIRKAVDGTRELPTDSFTYRCRFTDNDCQTSEATVTIPSPRLATPPRWPLPMPSPWPKAVPPHRWTTLVAPASCATIPALADTPATSYPGQRCDPRQPDPQRRRQLQLHPRRQRELQRCLHLPGHRQRRADQRRHRHHHHHSG